MSQMQGRYGGRELWERNTPLPGILGAHRPRLVVKESGLGHKPPSKHSPIPLSANTPPLGVIGGAPCSWAPRGSGGHFRQGIRSPVNVCQAPGRSNPMAQLQHPAWVVPPAAADCLDRVPGDCPTCSWGLSLKNSPRASSSVQDPASWPHPMMESWPSTQAPLGKKRDLDNIKDIAERKRNLDHFRD